MWVAIRVSSTLRQLAMDQIAMDSDFEGDLEGRLCHGRGEQRGPSSGAAAPCAAPGTSARVWGKAGHVSSRRRTSQASLGSLEKSGSFSVVFGLFARTPTYPVQIQ